MPNNMNRNKQNKNKIDNGKKRFVDYDFVLKKEEYNKKEKEIKTEEIVKNINRVRKNERKLFLLTILIMLMLIVLSYFLIMKSITKNDLKNIVQKETTDQVIEKELEAKRKITADEYILEKELINTYSNISKLNASIGKKDDKSINIDEKRVEKIEKGVENEEIKKEKIRTKIAENKKNNIDELKIKDESYDGIVKETYKIYLDKDNNCVYTSYIFKTTNSKLFEKEKDRISNSEKYSNVVVNNSDYEKDDVKSLKQISAYVSEFENMKLSDIINEINKQIKTTKFELIYNIIDIEKKS